uniref:ORF84b n=1 Tax=Pinus koraiensis TaxID=88728 RepID=A4QM00_PINKO|nr:ORF84b [Pinus koraiensis]ABP35308.1 ORF84b [Pinus koraiensis]
MRKIKNKNSIGFTLYERRKGRAREGKTGTNEISLGRKDSNLRITGSKPAALPLGHAPFPSYFPIHMLMNTYIKFFVNPLGSKIN